MNNPSINIRSTRQPDGTYRWRLTYQRGQRHFGDFATRDEARAFRAKLTGPLYSHNDITAACIAAAGGAA